jgi:hypothetical protein
MALPFVVFWFIIFFARHELGWRNVAICVAIWSGLLAAILHGDLSPYIFVAAQAPAGLHPDPRGLQG